MARLARAAPLPAFFRTLEEPARLSDSLQRQRSRLSASIVMKHLLVLVGLMVIGATVFWRCSTRVEVAAPPSIAHSMPGRVSGSPSPAVAGDSAELSRRELGSMSTEAALEKRDGKRLTGKVLDELGHAVVGASLRIAKMKNAVAVSGPNGFFAFESLLAPSTVTLRMDCASHILAGRDLAIDIQPGHGDQFVLVNAISLPSITGWIRATDGRPAEGYRITHDPGLAGYRSRAVADSAGRFCLFAPQPVEATVTRLIADHCAEFGLMVKEVATTWGARDVEILVERSSVLELQVVAAADQAPIGRYRLFVASLGHADLIGQRLNAPYRTVASPEGRTRLHLLPGETHVAVFPDCPGVLPKVSVVNLPEPGTAVPLLMALQSVDPIRVRVSGVEGPIKGAKVLALIDKEGAANGDARLPQWDQWRGVPIPTLGSSGIICEDTTDPDGAVFLTLPPQRAGTLRLRISASGYAPGEVELAMAALPGEILCELQRAAKLTVRLGPPQLLAFGPALRVAGGTPGAWFPADDSGTVVFENLPPGRYTVDLSFAAMRGVLVHADVGSINVLGEASAVDLDLTKLLPSSLAGTALVDGLPAGRLRLHRRSSTGAERSWCAETRSNGTGGFRFETVPVGNFAVSIPIGAIPLVPSWSSSGWNGTPIQITMRTRNADLVVTDHEGNPLDAGVLLWVACVHAPQMATQIATGEGGHIRLERVDAAQQLQVTVVQGAGSGRSGLESYIGAKRVTLSKD
jgi:hypothetical protein